MSLIETPPRQRRGLIVVIGLAFVFFTLLVFIAITARDTEKRERPELPAEEMYVVASRMRIRTQPSAKAPVLATQSRGDKLTLIDEQEGWAKVRNGEGIEGWAERNAMERRSSAERRIARNKAIRKLPPLEGVVQQRSDVFAGPGIFYPIIGSVRPPKKLRVFTRDHDFFAVDLDGNIGYVDVAAVSLSAGEGTPRVEVAAADEPEEEELEPVPPPELPEVPQVPDVIAETPPIADEGFRDVYAVVPEGGRQPEVLERVPPRYPGRARRAGVEGTVVLRGIVGTDGRIRDVEILKDLPYDLGDAARAAVRRWRFRPAEYRGREIAVYYTVTVNYRLTQ